MPTTYRGFSQIHSKINKSFHIPQQDNKLNKNDIPFASLKLPQIKSINMQLQTIAWRTVLEMELITIQLLIHQRILEKIKSLQEQKINKFYFNLGLLEHDVSRQYSNRCNFIQRKNIEKATRPQSEGVKET
eukprot:403363503